MKDSTPRECPCLRVCRDPTRPSHTQRRTTTERSTRQIVDRVCRPSAVEIETDPHAEKDDREEAHAAVAQKPPRSLTRKIPAAPCGCITTDSTILSLVTKLCSEAMNMDSVRSDQEEDEVMNYSDRAVSIPRVVRMTSKLDNIAMNIGPIPPPLSSGKLRIGRVGAGEVNWP